MLVTLEEDPGAVAAAVRATGVRWVQLHGYGRPVSVRRLRDALGPGVALVKVLHLTADGCVEASLAAAYGRAGTDLFLLDHVGPGGRGQHGAAGAGRRPPGGRGPGPAVPAGRRGVGRGRGAVPRHGGPARLRGIDVDTAARGRREPVPGVVTAVRAAWSPVGPGR